MSGGGGGGGGGGWGRRSVGDKDKGNYAKEGCNVILRDNFSLC